MMTRERIYELTTKDEQDRFKIGFLRWLAESRDVPEIDVEPTIGVPSKRQGNAGSTK
jgi:hypothetical protein